MKLSRLHLFLLFLRERQKKEDSRAFNVRHRRVMNVLKFLEFWVRSVLSLIDQAQFLLPLLSGQLVKMLTGEGDDPAIPSCIRLTKRCELITVQVEFIHHALELDRGFVKCPLSAHCHDASSNKICVVGYLNAL